MKGLTCRSSRALKRTACKVLRRGFAAILTARRCWVKVVAGTTLRWKRSQQRHERQLEGWLLIQTQVQEPKSPFLFYFYWAADTSVSHCLECGRMCAVVTADVTSCPVTRATHTHSHNFLIVRCQTLVTLEEALEFKLPSWGHRYSTVRLWHWCNTTVTVVSVGFSHNPVSDLGLWTDTSRLHFWSDLAENPWVPRI